VRVLNTRPHEQAAELSRLLPAAGFEVVEAPAIATEPAWSPDALAAARRDLASGAFAWVVLPSQNAGHALVSDLRRISDRVLCGRASCEALGLSGATTLERFSAGAALKLLRSRVHSGVRVLVPRAAEGRDELIDGLRELGADVFAPVAYRTIADAAAAERLRDGDIDVVTLCSPSAAASIAQVLTPDVLVACLGQTTADAARALGLRVDVVAQHTSMASLVEAVASLTGARV
jgi:uroporphyrinogen-III synthase